MIFGADDRVPVADTTVPPASAIVWIVTRFPNGLEEISTGVLVGPNDVLTAAHVLYEADFGGHVDAAILVAGRNGALTPFGTASAVSIQVNPGWIAANDRDGTALPSFDHDLALITVDRDLGSAAGFLAYGTLDDPIGRLARSIGYPGDLGGDVPVATEGSIDAADAETLMFTDDFDAFAGQSGSPVLVDGLVVGIYSHQAVEPPFFNGALRLTDHFVALTDLWRSTNDVTEGPDFVLGGIWPERWDGAGGDDRLYGRDGGDTVTGGPGSDEVNGNAGDDALDGGPGSDAVLGGQGSDTVEGGPGDDWHVAGNRGDDLVYGGEGDDALFGGPDADRLEGGPGADTLSGDRGDDVLAGGEGADVIALAIGGGSDRVEGFAPGEGDRIRLPAGLGGIGSAHDAVAALLLEDGHAVLPLGEGNRLTLLGISPGQIDAAAFWLA